jgi:hypothetical protein
MNGQEDLDYNKLTLCYKTILEKHPELTTESLSVVKTVHDFRRFWKPQHVKVVLLAESHVYTEDSELQVLLKQKPYLPADYPRNFVRFVYCLGYGESDLLCRSIESNAGTWQYWKIFHSCLNDIAKRNGNFSRILKGGTKDVDQRVLYKIKLLNQLKANGIWLVDASIVGINKAIRSDRMKIIKLCWENYIGDLIKNIKPKSVIVVGDTVATVVAGYLHDMSVKYSRRPQPQKRVKAQVHLDSYKHYFTVCSHYCSTPHRDSNDGSNVAVNSPLPLLSATDNPSRAENNSDGSKRIKTRDYTKYIFDGVAYAKSKLVLEVLRSYLRIHPATTYLRLKDLFPDSIQFSGYGVFQKKEHAIKINDERYTRFYTKDKDILRTHDNVEIAVCNQWSKDNIKGFLKAAKRCDLMIKEG